VSTIKVNRIENTSTTDGGVSIDVNGHVTIDGQQLPTAGPLSNRNIVINGAMQVAQRGNNFAGVTTGPSYAVDRWRWQGSSIGTWEMSQSAEAPTSSGFAKSFKAECTSGASVSAGSFALIRTVLEGQDLQRFAKGTASAKSFALSFWVRSTTTGTYSIYLYDNDNQREISATYTIDAINTWEYKSIIIDPDTVGAWANDNGDSLYVNFYLAAGSNFTSGTFNSTWQADNSSGRASSSQAQLNTTGQQFYITGVQLEVGSKATPFEHESYGQTLAKCQRYCTIIDLGTNLNPVHWMFNRAGGTGSPYTVVDLPTTMRSGPNFNELGSPQVNSTNANFMTATSAGLTVDTAVAAHQNYAQRCSGTTGTFLKWQFTAEL
jgi:hypothetical protein